jgi:hypothetical protein
MNAEDAEQRGGTQGKRQDAANAAGEMPARGNVLPDGGGENQRGTAGSTPSPECLVFAGGAGARYCLS